MLIHSDEILRKTFYYSAQALESNKKSRAEQGKHRRRHDKLWFLSIKLFIQAGAPFVKILYLTDLAQKLLSLRIFSYLCAEITISARI